jgi:hypothetical protein
MARKGSRTMADRDMSEICEMELSGFSEPQATNGNDAGGGGEVIGGVVLRR